MDKNEDFWKWAVSKTFCSKLVDTATCLPTLVNPCLLPSNSSKTLPITYNDDSRNLSHYCWVDGSTSASSASVIVSLGKSLHLPCQLEGPTGGAAAWQPHLCQSALGQLWLLSSSAPSSMCEKWVKETLKWLRLKSNYLRMILYKTLWACFV